MSNNKQSSVEWLENEFASLYFDYLTGLIDNKEYNERHKVIIEKAKAMHKEESITYARNFAKQMLQNERFVTAEIIYNETFNNKEK